MEGGQAGARAREYASGVKEHSQLLACNCFEIFALANHVRGIPRSIRNLRFLIPGWWGEARGVYSEVFASRFQTHIGFLSTWELYGWVPLPAFPPNISKKHSKILDTEGTCHFSPITFPSLPFNHKDPFGKLDLHKKDPCYLLFFLNLRIPHHLLHKALILGEDVGG